MQQVSAHDRLVALWDALEARGAVVDRIPLDTITAATANRLSSREEYRLSVLAEEMGPAPDRLEHVERAALLNSIFPRNPQGCSSSDPQPVYRTIEREFDQEQGCAT